MMRYLNDNNVHFLFADSCSIVATLRLCAVHGCRRRRRHRHCHRHRRESQNGRPANNDALFEWFDVFDARSL